MPDTASHRFPVDEIRRAYEASADEWASGPAKVYRRLAVTLVDSARTSLAGHRVLDLGTGTGVASEVLTAAGARPVGVDLAVAMLWHRQAHRPPGVVGDAQTLPFRDSAFDAVVAAFSLNHVPDPVTALGECRRVTRTGGLVLASVFPKDADHPAKAAVEAVLEQFGYQRPSWYQTLKEHTAPRTGDPELLAQAATAAGFIHVQVDHAQVEAGLDDPQMAIEWRLNMPHTIGFVAGLDASTRARLRTRAAAELPHPLPSSVSMLTLRAHVA